ncbi:hypothetical protein ACEE21_15340 [Clostridium baratii]
MREWLSMEDIEKKRLNYLKSIDPYVEYIESLAQYRLAVKRNKQLSDLVSYCSNLIEDMGKAEGELKVKGFEGKVEYSKGYFRTIINGVYRYKKSSVVYSN